MLLVPLAAVIAAYLPHLGHGFIKDDFAWILGSRVEGLTGLLQLLSRDNGFYRPWVSLSFAADEALFGLRPFGYGFTNLLLVLAAMLALYALARALGLGPRGAALAAGLWGLNPHGIGGAILWISGRTSLWLTLWALVAAWAFVRGRPLLASLAVLLALFSKEEALSLPFVLVAWAGLGAGRSSARWDWRAAVRAACFLLPPVALYAVLRLRTGAFLPATAPVHYRLTLDGSLLLRNALEYADRSGTLVAATLLAAAWAARARPRLDANERRLALMGALWLMGGFALTLFVPVRSSLYVLFPSAGPALAGAAALASVWRAADEPVRRRLGWGALLAVLALVPLHWTRNVRLERTARVSASALLAVRGVRSELASGKTLVFLDDPASKTNLAAAFGTLVREAVRLETGLAQAEAWIEPPPPGWQWAGLRRPDGPTVELRLAGAEVVRP